MPYSSNEVHDMRVEMEERYGRTMRMCDIRRELGVKCDDSVRKFVRDNRIRKGNFGTTRTRYCTRDVARAISCNMNE